MRKAIALGLAAMMGLGMPAGSLAAGTTAAVSGTAKDARGGGLVNVGLRVRNASRGHVVLETRTGASGEFSTPTLQPGIYIIEALGSSGQVIGVSTVSVIAGQTAAVTVTAAEGQSPQTLSQAGFSISGLGPAASAGIAAAAASASVRAVGNEADAAPPSPSQ
jgi:hypothetical protein